MKKPRSKKWLVAVAVVIAILAGICAWALQRGLVVSQYEIPLPEGMERLDGYRIAQISDLHNADLERKLAPALEQLQPDLIVITGDLVSRRDRDFTNALAVVKAAVQIAPTYFVRGNHEVDNPDYARLRQGLEEAGVTVLENQGVILEYHGVSLDLVGVEDISAFSENQEKGVQAMVQTTQGLFVKGAYHVLLSHRPNMLDAYAASGADLVFAGHAHGGQVRLPLVGPLFAPDEGLFPKVTEGVHAARQAQVVVSRGLGNHAQVPRLWDPPELVAVTLRAQESLPGDG